MKYRREIDGLRALAVLPVILCHAGFSLFDGGFVGVDVFFVISGYLITGILLEALARGEFSIQQFYARRARRILPALFVVMLACLPVAFFWMLPSQHEDFSQSLIAVVLFVSNVYFWQKSGYFAAEASEKPLLHTWSLGVEEQYYLFFPLLLWMLWRLGQRGVFYGIVLGIITSFAMCEYASRYAPNANFFLIPTRAWELFVGSLCAWIAMYRTPAKRPLLVMAGLGLILVAIVTFNDHMRLPSVYSFVPVLGAAWIVLYATPESWAGRILAAPPMVGIGLISYSAYLWHFPLFAFARIHSLEPPSTALMLGLSAATLALAALSWRFIEQPFRIKQHPYYVTNARALVLACVSIAMILGAGAYGYATQGRLAFWKNHAHENQMTAYTLLQQARQDKFYDNQDCVFRTSTLSDAVAKRYVACQKKYGPGIAVIGDSHAIDLFFVLKARATDRKFFVGLSQGMCRPHSPLPTCYHDAFLEMLKTHPGLFRDIIYEQSGSHLLLNAAGIPIDRSAFQNIPINGTVPNFAPNSVFVDATAAYLTKLSAFARVTWLGPRIEPNIRESIVIHNGCDYPFALRPNQQHVFDVLDETIRSRTHGSPIHYRSHIALMKFDMARDFINCEATYWKDGDHFSPAGDVYFGQRITLSALLRNKEAP